MEQSPPASSLASSPGWVVLLLAVFLAAGANSLVRDSATFDETAHLPAGFSYLDRGDFRLNPEHPPLSKVWAALPLWAGNLARPDYDSTYWRGTPTAKGGGSRSKASQWLFGYEFLNGPLDDPARLNPARLLVPARLAMLFLGAVLVGLIYAWSRELWGYRGALLSLFLACLSPTLLAHARLVTTDLPSGLGFTAVLWGFWRFCSRPTWPRALVVAVAMAGALLVKFSALLLPPTLGLLGLIWAGWPGLDRSERRRRWVRLLGLSLLVAVVAYAGIWAGYGFHYAAAEPGYALDWEIISPQEGAASRVVHAALEARLLPEAYLYGLSYFLGGAERRLAFLNGEQALVGWWTYFPQAFLIKTPPALTLLLAWLAVAALRRRRWRSFAGWCLLLPVAIYLGVSIGSNLNIGHRHLVPIYPLLFVLCGALPAWWSRSRARSATALVLLACYAVSFSVATPRYLSYFNFLVGGSRNGWHYLLDSNLDWGQDLARLGRWMDREGVEEIDLAYFGTADPEAYGIRYRKVAMVHDFHPERRQVRPAPGRVVAVSANLLQGLYSERDREFAEALHRRGWLRNDQGRQWIALRDRLSAQGLTHPDLASWAVGRGIISEDQRRTAEAGLLSTWIARLRDEELPLARVGDSIFVYRAP